MHKYPRLMNNFILFLGKVCSKLEIQYERHTETQLSSTNNSGPGHYVLQKCYQKAYPAASALQAITTKLWTYRGN